LKLTKEAEFAVNQLVDNGIMCFSHTVLLKRINNTTKDLKLLLSGLAISLYIFDVPDGYGYCLVDLNIIVKSNSVKKSIYCHDMERRKSRI